MLPCSWDSFSSKSFGREFSPGTWVGEGEWPGVATQYSRGGDEELERRSEGVYSTGIVLSHCSFYPLDQKD